MIVNISNNQKVLSSDDGSFEISAKPGNEIRILKDNYERNSHTVIAEDLTRNIIFVLNILPTEIAEVEIKNKLTGDLKKDAISLNRENPMDKVNENIGLPLVEKPRKKPAQLSKDVLLPILFGNINIQAIYDLVSGDARRLRNWYKYEDMQTNIGWIRERLPDNYFNEFGIPTLRINEFLEFSILVESDVLMYIRAKNIDGVIVSLENPMKEYTSRIRNCKIH